MAPNENEAVDALGGSCEVLVVPKLNDGPFDLGVSCVEAPKEKDGVVSLGAAEVPKENEGVVGLGSSGFAAPKVKEEGWAEVDCCAPKPPKLVLLAPKPLVVVGCEAFWPKLNEAGAVEPNPLVCGGLLLFIANRFPAEPFEPVFDCPNMLPPFCVASGCDTPKENEGVPFCVVGGAPKEGVLFEPKLKLKLLADGGGWKGCDWGKPATTGEACLLFRPLAVRPLGWMILVSVSKSHL